MFVCVQEYEKRLLAKDQEFKLGQEAQVGSRVVVGWWFWCINMWHSPQATPAADA